MDVLAKILILQVLVAVVAVYVLKRLLDKDLLHAALERAFGFSPSEAAKKAEKIAIVSAGSLPADIRGKFVAVFREKCPNAGVEFLENPALKGGLVIEIAGEIWDHSLMTRLKHLVS